MKLLSAPETKTCENVLTKRKLQNHEPLKDALKVKQRNAGERTSLLHAKSIRARNDVIHKAVEYIAGGDIKCEY